MKVTCFSELVLLDVEMLLSVMLPLAAPEGGRDTRVLLGWRVRLPCAA